MSRISDEGGGAAANGSVQSPVMGEGATADGSLQSPVMEEGQQLMGASRVQWAAENRVPVALH